MKTAFAILVHDLKALVRNPLALLVVGALMILPGLYAWYCIVANWDPYSNTGNMPIAVVNEDRGASSSLAGELNVGDSIVRALEDNDSIDWRFYDNREEALEDTSLSVCYAAIVFPEDLSENLLGIIEGADEAPEILYFPNEKHNAVATKVTDSAAKTLVLQVDQQFASTVNEKVLATAENLNGEVQGKVERNHASVLAEVREVQADLAEAITQLDDVKASIAGWKANSAGLQSALDVAVAELSSASSGLEQGQFDLDALAGQLSELETGFTATLIKTGGSVSTMSARATADIGAAAANLNSVKGDLNAIASTLRGIVESIDDPVIKAHIMQTLEDLRALNDGIDEAVQSANESAVAVNEKLQKRVSSVEGAADVFASTVTPQLDTGIGQLARAFSGLSAAIDQFEPQVVQLKDLLAQADDALDRVSAAADNAQALFSDISAHLETVAIDLGSIGSALQVDTLSDLLNVEPERLGEFISSPVQLVTEKIYPTSNYGTAVAPFYTNLALWVGCFILISIMKVEVGGEFARASATQRYFGRWLLFVMLSLIQSQVICGVDILLGIDCAHPALFMLSGAICSFAYMNLIFALVIAFRNVGKTLCILLLIMQVPGSSGMYPIEMMPTFFQLVHPWLPFTYGIDAMREALCGLYGARFIGDVYLGDLLVLLALIPLSLLLGVLLRPRLMNLVYLFDTEMRKTGFFATEEHGQTRSTRSMRSLMRALSADDSYRDRFEERAWKFNRMYPLLRRIGSIALFAIPAIFLVVMLPVNLSDVSIDAKLGEFIFVIVLLLVASAALIVLEYMHRVIREETELLGASIMGPELFAQTLLDDYDTLFDQAENVRREARAQVDDLRDAAYERVQRAKTELADGMLSAVPPLSEDAVSMIPATDKATEAAQKPPSAKRDRRRRFGATGDIFRTDLRLGFQSVIGAVVIMLLVITPSLYAWFNIAGSWDPYSATGNLKVAVANCDEGYTSELVSVPINVGDTVESQLRGNSSFDWQFVAADDAVAGVTSGEYYAAIVIPGSFSRSMMTYLYEQDDYPDVVYYSNEKENPIAPIIMQKGADSIQENIRASFTQKVDEVALTIANSVLKYATNPSVSEYAQKVSRQLDNLVGDMMLGSGELHTLSDVSSVVSGVASTAKTAIEGVRSAGETAAGAVRTAKEGALSASSAFSAASAAVEELVGDGDADIGKIEAIIDGVLAVLANVVSEVPGSLATVKADLSQWISGLEDMKEQLDDPAEIARVESVIRSLENLSATADAAISDASAASDDIGKTRGEVAQIATDVSEGTAEARSLYETRIKLGLGNLKSSLNKVSESTGAIISDLKDASSGLSDGTAALPSQLDALSLKLWQVGDQLDGGAQRIADTKARVNSALASEDAHQLAEALLDSNPSELATVLSAPVEEVREAMYPVANFGSSMAPFYTVLSLWVGALVMISTMRVHVVEERLEELRTRYRKVSSSNEFFGRYGIFGFISLLQSLLVLMGDLVFLHIQCENPVLFVMFGVIIGQVFCLFVYTLTELFGSVGKALCVILLIMQVAASGGTFPAQMLDPMLSQIVPFLPFFHAMNLLQECVAGMYWPSVGGNVGFLLIAVAVLLLIGVVVRKPFRKLNDFFEEQLEKTGYM